MTRRNRSEIPQLPVHTAIPVQLVLGLEGVGIRKPKRRRRSTRWIPTPAIAAAA